MTRPGGALAIDHGDRRTGFAFADALGVTRTPLEPFRGAGDSQALLDHVARLLDERDVDVFVVGLPLDADGREGPRCAVVRAFAARLVERFGGLRVELLDEHLTTKAAEDLLREAGRDPRAARGVRDSWSALVLLEDWLRSGR